VIRLVETDADVFRELRMTPGELPTEPLGGGELR